MYDNGSQTGRLPLTQTTKRRFTATNRLAESVRMSLAQWNEHPADEATEKPDEYLSTVVGL